MSTLAGRRRPWRAAWLVVALALITSAAVAAAGADAAGSPEVNDEIVVQVNGGVIMLSQVKRQSDEVKSALARQGPMTTEQADGELRRRQPELILGLIDEMLLLQKGRDLNLSDEVEAEVNREVLRVARQSNLFSFEALESAMREEGVRLGDVRQTMARNFLRQAVLQREVYAKVFAGWTDQQVRDHYEAHRDRFVRVVLSELFLGLAGRSAQEVGARAADLAAQARANPTRFAQLVQTHSERESSRKTRGVVSEGDGAPRWFVLSELPEAIAAPLQRLQAGGVTGPIQRDDGYLVLRVEQRDPSFSESVVRSAMTRAHADAARAAYLKQLRDDAHIAVAAPYRALLEPYLSQR